MTDPAVHLVVPALPENVGLIRHALSGFGDALGMDEESSSNLKTAITEACNNAVIHAYDDGNDGVLDVTAGERGAALEITVRDFGQGFQPRIGSETHGLRLGLPLIAAMTSGFELNSSPGGGTTLRMLLPLSAADAQSDAEPAERPAPAEPGYAVLSVGDDDLASVIVSRMIASLAARADLSIDRLSDAMLLSDAISSAGGQRFLEGRTRVAVAEIDGVVSVRVGPLGEGGGESLLASLEIPALKASLAKLADDAAVERDEGGEHLVLRIAGGAAARTSASG